MTWQSKWTLSPLLRNEASIMSSCQYIAELESGGTQCSSRHILPSRRISFISVGAFHFGKHDNNIKNDKEDCPSHQLYITLHEDDTIPMPEKIDQILRRVATTKGVWCQPIRHNQLIVIKTDIAVHLTYRLKERFVSS